MKSAQTFQTAMNYLESGKAKQALRLSKTAMRNDPNDARFANIAGLALSQSGKPREGATFFARALKAEPGSTQYQDNLITALVQSGQLDKARKLIRQLLEKRPDTGPLYYQLAMIAFQMAAPLEAIEAASRAIEAGARTHETTSAAVPGQTLAALARTHNLRAVLRDAIGDEDGALADYERALTLDPNNAEALTNIAIPLARRLDPEAALTALEKVLSLNPRHINALHRYGLLLNELGRVSEARRAFAAVLQIAPGHADSLRMLADLATAEDADVLKPSLTAALAKANKGSLDCAAIGFGLAALAAKTGTAEDMIRAYKTANADAARLRPYDVAAAQRTMDRIMAQFPAGQSGQTKPITGQSRPIFVIGLPRSGTTLIERVLSAHPCVLGLGERASVGRLSDPHISDAVPFDAEAAIAFSDQYFAGLPDAAAQARFIVDKMPANYKYLGFILAAMPDAVILNVCRDPRDIAWSMWRAWFPNTPMNYVFDQSAMAWEVNAYQRYMRFWQDHHGDRIHDVRYEDTVADITGTSQRLAQICGLTWDPAMAAPDRNTDTIRTASANQARVPVHQKSVGGWRAHADALSVFIDGLEPDLWPGLD